jgi:hypothetical protein
MNVIHTESGHEVRARAIKACKLCVIPSSDTVNKEDTGNLNRNHLKEESGKGDTNIQNTTMRQ